MVPILTQHVTTQIEAFSEFNVLNVKEILGATIQMRAVKRLYYWLRTVLQNKKEKQQKQIWHPACMLLESEICLHECIREYELFVEFLLCFV